MGFERNDPSRNTKTLVSHGLKRSNDTARTNTSSSPLAPSKMTNQQYPIGTHPAGPKRNVDSKINIYDENQSAIDKLLSQLAQHEDYNSKVDNIKFEKLAVKSTTDTSPSGKSDGKNQEAFEMARLKKELEDSKNKIAVMDHELAQRSAKTTPALTSSSDMGLGIDSGDSWLPGGQANRKYTMNSQDNLSDSGVVLMPGGQQGGWMNNSPALTSLLNTPVSLGGQPFPSQPQPIGWGGPSRHHLSHADHGSGQGYQSRAPGYQASWHHNLRVDTSGNNQYQRGSMTNSPPEFMRASAPSIRPGSGFDQYPYHNNTGYNSYPMTAAPSTGYSPPMTPYNTMEAQVYQPRPIGTPLSPTALEFSASNGSQAAWNAQASSDSTSGYIPPMEPLNYRRLLDRNMSCNWKYIVDKIVCSNDQQASIFLQQKLKVSTPEQKFDLVEAIVTQAYPLMINRFGNFLVQRCFEHGTPEQVIAIGNAIRGNTLALSMDPFGCHVVQKAFDVVPEDYKAIMVHELLRRIPETVIHRYACHVWQKLFELRWSDSPPQIMKYVNEALRGMWHEVALGETGSLVVQNIFENCLEEDKRPCINEVLGAIDLVSHGQFGNWCIQHICEHGAPADKSRAIEHILRFSSEYSTDQFASKVVEKCLKVSGTDFLDRYLEKVCEGRADRPRMPLIDIAGDQYGNYLIQYILINADPQRREIVAAHIRKHMVSLRGSKFGSRVAMLCCNPASVTRPVPGMATGMQGGGRYMQQSQAAIGGIGMSMAPGSSGYVGRQGMHGSFN